MAKNKNNTSPLRFITIVGLLALAGWWLGVGNGGKDILKEGDNGAKAENNSISTSKDSATIVSKEEIKEVEDSLSQPLTDTLTTAVTQIEISTPKDSIQQADSKDSSQTTTPTPTVYVIKVSKKEGILQYHINQQPTNHLFEKINNIGIDKEFILQLSGNITYAEEQAVKDTLDSYEVKYVFPN